LTAVTSPNCFLMSMVETEANSTSMRTWENGKRVAAPPDRPVDCAARSGRRRVTESGTRRQIVSPLRSFPGA